MSKQDHILTVEVFDQDGSTFTLREICERGECHAEFVIELVDYGGFVDLAVEHERTQAWH